GRGVSVWDGGASGPACGGVWAGGPGGRGHAPAGGGPGAGGHHGGAPYGSRAASAARGAAAAAGRLRAAGSRSLLPASPRDSPPPAGQVVGAARGYEPGAAVAVPEQTGRGPGSAGGDLWLVHRGL